MLILGISGAAAVVITLVVVLATGGSGGGGGGKASGAEAVKGYLAALARGDAAAALTYSNDQPGSKDFLTDEILKKQIAQWPITNVKILSDDSSMGTSKVHVIANFGSQTTDSTLEVKKTDRGWKLDHSTIKMDLTATLGGENKSLKTLTFFGKPGAQAPVYLFPGWDDVGTSNENMSVTPKPMLLDRLSSYGLPVFSSDFKFELSDAGKKAVMSEVESDFEECTKTSSRRPPKCPVEPLVDFDLEDGTIQWGKPDTGEVKITSVNEYDLTAATIGKVTFPTTGKNYKGETKTGTAYAWVSGDADIAQNPPRIKWR